MESKMSEENKALAIFVINIAQIALMALADKEEKMTKPIGLMNQNIKAILEG